MTPFVSIAALAWLSAAGPASAEGTPGAPDWKALAPLLGDWEGVGTGQPGESSGGFTVRPELNGWILVRRNVAEVPATKDRAAFRHEDLMILFQEGGAIRAHYFDDEGHVIRYAVTAPPGERRITFRSEPGPGPRFRLTYTWSGPDALDILFEIAPSSAPERFQRYLEAKARRRGS